jgi:hypothetical protein
MLALLASPTRLRCHNLFPATLTILFLGLPLCGRGENAPAHSIAPTAVIAPDPRNPRNSEGDFIQLKDGRILFIYTHHYGGKGEDDAPAFLASRFSSDGGATWSKSSEQVIANEGKKNIMSVSLLRLASGNIALVYLRKHSKYDCLPALRLSTDEAKTWSPPIDIVPEKESGYYIVNNDRIVQLSSGRIIVPCAQHVDNTPKKWSAYAEAVCYLSDDNGCHWRRGRGVARVSRDIKTGLQEPGVVELSDGRLLMFCRTDAGAQFFAYSSDQGETWAHPAPSTLQSPLAPASIKRIPGTNDLLAIWNNNDTHAYHRTPLTSAVSHDDGRTWTNVKNLEDDPRGIYCYTAIEFAGDQVLLAYCAGRDTVRNGLSTTKLARLPLNWFTSQAP